MLEEKFDPVDFRNRPARGCPDCLSGLSLRADEARCPTCRKKKAVERFLSLPEEEHEGVVYSEARDRFYATPDAAADDLLPFEELADLRLLVCRPEYVTRLDVGDFWEHEESPPEELLEAIDDFNEAAESIVAGYSPQNVRLAVPAKIADRLRAEGYDGLVCPGECACELKELAPCGEWNLDAPPGYVNGCLPGFKKTLPNGSWEEMTTTKEEPNDETF